MRSSNLVVPRALGRAPILASKRTHMAGWRSTFAKVWQPIAMVAVLALVGGFAITLSGAQDGARVNLQERFQARLDLTGRFTTAYDTDVLARVAAVGARRLDDANPTPTEVANVLADFGFVDGMLLDGVGRALDIYPGQTDLIGSMMTWQYDYLARAVAGTPSVSNVVVSAVRRVPVVAFSAAFETPYGRRVLSGTFDVSTTPLSAHLRNVLPYDGGEVYLVDATDSLVASNVATDGLAHELDQLDPGIGAAMEKGGSGRYERDGVWRWFTTSPVSGSPFTVVASVPEDVLYAPLAGPSAWLPWVVVALLAMGSLYTVHVLFVLHRSREDYLALARIDPLTGVSNRRELSALADRMLAEAHGRQRSMAVLMIDLDHFKAINDSLGHEAGDEVLRVVTARMRNALRDDDLLGRWGGEEFVAILPATSMTQAMLVAERVRASVSEAPIQVNRSVLTTVSASVGCATTMDESIDEVISRADGAMYGAKRSGDAVEAAFVPV